MPRIGGQDPKNLKPQTHPRDHIIPESGSDTYRERAKFPEPTVCPGCSAVFHEGRWSWMDQSPPEANHQLCPACERSRDNYPAGFLTLSGPFLVEHYESVVNTLENEAVQETREHPLNRIMERRREGEDLVITTTDIHLPRRVGEALQNAYKGKLDFHYNKEDQILRARWER